MPEMHTDALCLHIVGARVYDAYLLYIVMSSESSLSSASLLSTTSYPL